MTRPDSHTFDHTTILCGGLNGDLARANAERNANSARKLYPLPADVIEAALKQTYETDTNAVGAAKPEPDAFDHWLPAGKQPLVWPDPNSPRTVEEWKAQFLNKHELSHQIPLPYVK